MQNKKNVEYKFANHVRNILEGKEAEIFKAILDSVYKGILIIDKEGYIIYFNDYSNRIFNINNYNFDNLHIKNIDKDINKKIFKYKLNDTYNSYSMTKIKNDKRLFINCNTIIYNKNLIGTLVAISADDADKNIVDIDCHCVVQKSLESIIQSTYDGIYVTDGKGITIKVNKAWENITGLTADQVLGRDTLELEKEGYVETFITPKILKKRVSISVQTVTCTNKEVLVSGNPVFDDYGNISMVVCTVRELLDINKMLKKIKNVQVQNLIYREEINRLKHGIYNAEDLVSESKPMNDILESVAYIANYSTPILITGNTGVGKEVIARIIHNNNNIYGKGNLLKINCGAIPETLLEAELFGYEPGAFTGANPKGKQGLLEQADGGTLILDEIGELSLQMQTKLLNVLQDYEISRLGSIARKKIDLRFIFITNRNLKEMTEEGTFRLDLYYRIKIITLHIPSLNERMEDVPALLNYYINHFNDKYSKQIQLSSSAVDRLVAYNWPGNIRELKNLLEHLVIMSEPDKRIKPNDLPMEYNKSKITFCNSDQNSLKQAVQDFEKQYIKQSIDKYGTIKEAARHLNTNPTTLYRKLQK